MRRCLAGGACAADGLAVDGDAPAPARRLGTGPHKGPGQLIEDGASRRARTLRSVEPSGATPRDSPSSASWASVSSLAHCPIAANEQAPATTAASATATIPG